MANQQSVAVIGAGIIGLSIAWRLAQAGCRVTIFDKGPLAREASWAGAGMLAPGGEIDPNPDDTGHASELASLCFESRALYGGFISDLRAAASMEIDHQECGALDLAYADEDWQMLQARAERQRTAGIHSRPIAPQKVSVFWPRVEKQNLCGALFYPGDAIVNPREVVGALITATRLSGVEICAEETITAIDVHPSGVLIEGKGRSVMFNQAVLAAGAWSHSIRVEGVPAIPRARPIKGHLIGYQQPDQTCGTILRRGHTYLLQRANGLLIAGATVEDVGFDRSIVEGHVAGLASQAGAILPHLRETTISETWTGFRPASDKVHIGRWCNSSLLIAYGHYRNGILLAPLTAEQIRDQVTSS